MHIRAPYRPVSTQQRTPRNTEVCITHTTDISAAKNEIAALVLVLGRAASLGS